MYQERLKTLTLVVSPEESEEIEKAAETLCINKSQLARMAIFQYIKAEVKK